MHQLQFQPPKWAKGSRRTTRNHFLYLLLWLGVYFHDCPTMWNTLTVINMQWDSLNEPQQPKIEIISIITPPTHKTHIPAMKLFWSCVTDSRMDGSAKIHMNAKTAARPITWKNRNKQKLMLKLWCNRWEGKWKTESNRNSIEVFQQIVFDSDIFLGISASTTHLAYRKKN